MMYLDFTAGNKDYKLRLSTRNTVMLEKQLGCNPLAIFGSGDTIPTITQMVNILYASLIQYNHGITLNDAIKILINQYVKQKDKKVTMQAIAYELTIGNSFSQALEKQGSKFPPLLINMLNICYFLS